MVDKMEGVRTKNSKSIDDKLLLCDSLGWFFIIRVCCSMMSSCIIIVSEKHFATCGMRIFSCRDEERVKHLTFFY